MSRVGVNVGALTVKAVSLRGDETIARVAAHLFRVNLPRYFARRLGLRARPRALRTPSPAKEGDCGCYEDSLTGGQVFTMYCSYCHNAPSLAERPYSQFRNVAAHRRDRANLTGKE